MAGLLPCFLDLVGEAFFAAAGGVPPDAADESPAAGADPLVLFRLLRARAMMEIMNTNKLPSGCATNNPGLRKQTASDIVDGNDIAIMNALTFSLDRNRVWRLIGITLDKAK